MTEHDEMLAFAHAVKPCLIDLGAQFTKPVQGEASHKVIGWNARRALRQVGWLCTGAGVGEPALEPIDSPCTMPGRTPIYAVLDPATSDSERDG